MENLLTAFGIKKFSIVIAGAVGGVISLRHYVDLTVKGKCIVIVSSMFLANYVTHPVALYFGAVDDFELGIAAAIGLFGLSLVSSATAIIKDTVLWKSLITRLIGGEK